MVAWKKMLSEWGVVALIVIIVGAYLANLLSSRYDAGGETMSSTPNKAYSNSLMPSSPGGVESNEVFAPISGSGSDSMLPTGCTNPNSSPDDLLPKDTHSQWAELNPQGKGELGNINLLNAGYLIGIDTVGSSMRNANLQIRSEPPNVQVYTGPWNQTTITPDFMRPPLQIGDGSQ